MNKTLLLILCDFLLLTILSMWKMEEDAPPEQNAASDATDEQSVSAMALMEQDLLDTLEYSLDEERIEREALASDLSSQVEELEKTKTELELREERIRALQQDMTTAAERERALNAAREELERKSKQLAEEVQETAESYETVQKRLKDSELNAQQTAAQSRLLQQELDKKLEEIAKKEAALAEAASKLNAREKEVQELNVQVRMSEQKSQFLEASVDSLKGEITAERTERVKLQEQAGKLAEGVSQLAENSQDLREEMRSNIPINANQMFSNYKNNQVTASFTSLKYQRNRYYEDVDNVSTILVSAAEKTYALLHIENGPFGLNSNAGLIRSIKLSLSRFGNSIDIDNIQFLALDPRILAIPVSKEQAAKIGGEVYLTALDPFRWEEAILVNRQGNYYGEVEFKLDASTPGYVKMQTKILSSIFGEFSPSKGDMVLSKTGELLGVMVNRRYCVLINNFLATGSIQLGDTLDSKAIQRTLNEQDNRLRGRLPFVSRHSGRRRTT